MFRLLFLSSQTMSTGILFNRYIQSLILFEIISFALSQIHYILNTAFIAITL